MADYREALQPIAGGAGSKSTRILRDLAPQILHPRILQSPAFRAGGLSDSSNTASSSSASSSSALTLTGPNSAFVSLARLRLALPSSTNSQHSSYNSNSARYGNKQKLTATDLRIIQGVDRLLDLPIPLALPTVPEDGEPESENQVGLYAGFSATAPSVSARKTGRRQRRARASERALGLHDPDATATSLGLRELSDRARGLLSTDGYEIESVESTAKRRIVKSRRRTTLHPGAAALNDRLGVSNGEDKLNADQAIEELSRTELEQELVEINLDKDALHVRRKLLNSDLSEIEKRIAKLQSVREELRNRLLNLKEEELELDDEREGIQDRLVALDARNAGRIISSTSSRRRRGPAFLPSEHDDLPPNMCFMTLATTTQNSYPTPPSITALDFSEPYGTLVSSYNDPDNAVRVWDLTDGAELAQLRGHRGNVKALLTEGNLCVTGGQDGQIYIWDLQVAIDEESDVRQAEQQAYANSYLGRRMREEPEDVFFASKHQSQTESAKSSASSLHDGQPQQKERDDSRDETSSIRQSSTQGDESNAPKSRLRCLGGHSKDVTCLSYEDTSLVSGSSDKTLRLWDLTTGQCVVTMDILWAISNPGQVDETEGATSTTASASETTTQNEAGSAARPNVPSPYRPSLSHRSPSSRLSYDSDYPWRTSSALVTPNRRQASLSGLRRLSSTYGMSSYAGSPNSPTTPNAHNNPHQFNFSQPTPPFSDGSWEMYSDFVGGLQLWSYALASGSADGCVRMWDTRTGQAVRTLYGHTGAVTCLQFDSLNLVSGSLDTSVRVWDLRTGRTVDTLRYDGPVTALQFDTRRILVAGGTNAVQVYNRTTLQQSELMLNGHTSPVERLRFMDRYLATGGKDGFVKIWNLQ